jgi:osmotically inducible protein OsmC
MSTVRHATASWSGDLLSGSGTVSAYTSGLFTDLPTSWLSRTEDANGQTSPEELLAAAHASCFSMAVSNELAKAGYAPDHVHVVVEVSAEKREAGWTVIGSAIQVVGQVPDITHDEFERIAGLAKLGCPISRALSPSVEVTLDATLEDPHED